MNQDLKSYIAEFIATFALIFIGAGSIITNTFTDGAVGLVGIALAHGLTIAIMVYTFGHISGAHINPAVTTAFLVTKRIEIGKGIGYIMSQIAGAALAGFALKLIYASATWSASHLGTPALSSGVSFGNGVLVEAILTFFLVLTIFATAVDERAPKSIYGFAIGLTITLDILMGGPLTGAAMNPARTLGPALASGFFENHLVYWIGPILGGTTAGLLYHHVFMSKE